MEPLPECLEENIAQASRLIEHDIQFNELKQLRQATFNKMIEALKDSEMALVFWYKEEIKDADQRIHAYVERWKIIANSSNSSPSRS